MLYAPEIFVCSDWMIEECLYFSGQWWKRLEELDYM